MHTSQSLPGKKTLRLRLSLPETNIFALENWWQRKPILSFWETHIFQVRKICSFQGDDFAVASQQIQNTGWIGTDFLFVRWRFTSHPACTESSAPIFSEGCRWVHVNSASLWIGFLWIVFFFGWRKRRGINKKRDIFERNGLRYLKSCLKRKWTFNKVYFFMIQLNYRNIVLVWMLVLWYSELRTRLQ